MKVICVANQKGGVGKTTSAVNIAAGLSMAGKRTLLIDVDPQGNATSAMNEKVKSAGDGFNAYHVFVNPQCIDGAIAETDEPNLCLVPADHELVKLDQVLSSSPNANGRMRDALARIEDRFDFVIIDCPPSLSLIPLNCLSAASGVIIPIQAEYYPLEGLSQIVEIIDLVKNHDAQHLAIEGILITMFDPEQALGHEVLAEARKNFNEQVFETMIPRDVALAEAPSYGVPVFDYAPASLGAMSYAVLVNELVGS